jgi:aspartate dehydrogenase
MRVGIIGGGVIARLFLEHIQRGELGDARVVVILGRSAQSRGKPLADEFGVKFATTLEGLLAEQPDVIVEAASHEAVREFSEPLLARGLAVMVLSGGALADDALRAKLERTARENKGFLYVPSGGIGGLDALKAACVAGVDEVSIEVNKPPAAWKGIEYVEKNGFVMDGLKERVVLYDGPARAGVVHFPANVNIAAVLSMAGVGFDKTRLRAVADPNIRHNTHFIEVRGNSGNISIKFENVPSRENPKTAWLACYSALAALTQVKAPVRYGT